MQFISRLLLCNFDVVSFAKKVQNGELTKACCGGGGGELRFRGGYARFGGGRTVGWTCIHPSCRRRGPPPRVRRGRRSTCGNRWTLVCLQCRAVGFDNRLTLLATLLFTNSLDFRKMFRKMMFREDQKDDVLKICNDGSMHC